PCSAWWMSTPVPRIPRDRCALGQHTANGGCRTAVAAAVRPCPVLVSGPMARRSLRPELNRIRAWVRQGRTDAWIAHQLEVTVQQIQAFKREQGLVTGEEPNGAPGDYEIDLRAEDDA